MRVIPEPQLDMSAIRNSMDILRQIDLNAVTIDEIKDHLKPMFVGYMTEAPQFDPGLQLYQGYEGQKPVFMSELEPVVGRHVGIANRLNEPMAYFSSAREAALFATHPNVGDTMTIIQWETTAPILVNYVGYSSNVFSSLGSNRSVASWGNEAPGPISDEQQEIKVFLADAFMRVVPQDEQENQRKVTIAIAEKLLMGEMFDGLIYPSVALRANADDFALRPSFASKNVRFVRAEQLRIDGIEGLSYSATPLAMATNIAADGTLEWTPVISDQWGYRNQSGGAQKLSLSERYGTIGWQEFIRQKKDILNRYDAAKDANKNRPVQTEQGNVAEASFREWLSGYLPKKYAVTSGFIIPDVRSLNYVLNHYDVIIYDVMNSPVLWGSDNPDKSEQGRALAIPAKYVHAVFEVKSAFTKSSIIDAKKKLHELDTYQEHLSDYFTSGMIFFEARIGEHKSCKLVEELFDSTIAGYFGGLILRAEGIDPNVTGYALLHSAGHDTVEAMPLVREIGDLEVNERGEPMLTRQGDFINAYAAENVWHIEKGYSPVVEDVGLYWSYNSFPRFFVDLLDRLQGTYNPTEPNNQGALGYSFYR